VLDFIPAITVEKKALGPLVHESLKSDSHRFFLLEVGSRKSHSDVDISQSLTE